jgi:hypothetical protein
LVIDKHNWSNTDESLEIFGEIVVKSIGNKPLCGALRVTEPDHLVEVALGVREYILYVCRDIILTHLVHSEIPEFLIINSPVDMFVRIGSSTVVSSPHVVSEINKLKREIKSGIIEEPSAAIIDKTVLHDHRLAKDLTSLLRSLSWDSEGGENVAIVSYDLVLLKEISTALYLFLQGPVIGLGIGELGVEHIITEAS